MNWIKASLILSLVFVLGCKSSKELSKNKETFVGTWELAEQSGIQNLDQAFPSGKPTLTFENKNKLNFHGFDGCNNIHSSAVLVSKNELKIAPEYISTLKGCINIKKDVDFNFLVQKATKYELTSDVLTLSSKEGKLKFYRKTLNGQWLLNKVFFGNTKAKDLYPYKKPFIIIDKNSTHLAGNTACNTIVGKIDISKDKMKFSQMSTTKIYCEGINEELFIDALSRITHYKLNGIYLTLYQNNKAVLEMIRKIN